MTEPKTILHAEAYVPAPSIGVSALALKGLPPLKDQSFDDALSVQNTFEKFPELRSLSNNRERRAWLAKKQREMHREGAALRRSTDALEWEHELIHDIIEWVDNGVKLERCEAPSFKAMRKAVNDGKSIYLSKKVDAVTPAGEFEKEVFRFAEVLLVQHDWGGAFASADLKDVTVRLPYEVCAFEFQFSGRPVIALATQFETDVAFAPMIQGKDGWGIPDFVVPLSGYAFEYCNDGILDLLHQIAAQITAVCVALDAEVATSDVVREPYATGRVKSNAYMIPKGYHVVSLANRGPRALPSDSSNPSGRRVRMHFRRGHWRHFDDHKTWIKWMLVGNPDLGFVEKHYRL